MLAANYLGRYTRFGNDGFIPVASSDITSVLVLEQSLELIIVVNN